MSIWCFSYEHLDCVRQSASKAVCHWVVDSQSERVGALTDWQAFTSILIFAAPSSSLHVLIDVLCRPTGPLGWPWLILALRPSPLSPAWPTPSARQLWIGRVPTGHSSILLYCLQWADTCQPPAAHCGPGAKGANAGRGHPERRR